LPDLRGEKRREEEVNHRLHRFHRFGKVETVLAAVVVWTSRQSRSGPLLCPLSSYVSAEAKKQVTDTASGWSPTQSKSV
jgi:hypothetical protein